MSFDWFELIEEEQEEAKVERRLIHTLTSTTLDKSLKNGKSFGKTCEMSNSTYWDETIEKEVGFCKMSIIKKI